MADVVDPQIAALKYEHGTRARYALGKCRCEPCRVASREYERARTRRRQKAWVIEFAAFALSTSYAAKNGGKGAGRYVVRHRDTGEIVLRTLDRAEAFADAKRRNAQIRSTDAGEIVSAARARRRLTQLSEQQIGLRAISLQTKISRSALQEIIGGKVKRVRRGTLEAILAVVPAVRAGAYVPAAPTWALLEQILATGRSRKWIAAQLGQHGRAIQVGRERVRAKTAARVSRLHKLVMANDAQARAAAAPPTAAQNLRAALQGWDADEFAVRLSRLRSPDVDAAPSAG